MKFKGSFTATSANGEYKLSITDNGIIITGDISADYSTGKVIFDVAAARENIASGETFEELFGKVKRYFTDLKTVAFTGSYKDLIDKPNIPDVSQLLTQGQVQEMLDSYAYSKEQGDNRYLLYEVTGDIE